MFRNLSLRKIFYYITIGVCIPLAAMMIILFGYSVLLQRAHQKEVIQNALNEMTQDISTSVSSIENTVLSVYQSMDYLTFCNTKKENELRRRANSFLNSYKGTFLANREVVAVFLLHTETDTVFPLYRSFEHQFLSELTAQTLEDIHDSGSVQTSFVTYNQNIYGITATRKRYGILLTVFDPSRNIRYTSYSSILSGTVSFSFAVEAVDHTPGISIVSQVAGMPLWIICSRLSYSGFNAAQIVLLTFIILLLALIPMQFILFERILLQPISKISEAMNIISDGDLEYRVKSDTAAVREIRNLSDGMNHMLDRIHDYREEGFNSRMDAVQAKLQYLQLQIRPHFFLNCLKNLSALLSLKHIDQAQALVFALSDYISYAFSDIKNFVPLQEELESVRSYVNLCNMLSYDIRLSFHLSGKSNKAKCLPMSVLTFVENSIKHTKQVDHLSLSIDCSVLYEDTDEPELQIVIKDSGGGFPESYLEEQNHADPSEIIYRRSQIGISNVRYRLWLIYEDSADLHLYNEDNHAVVEITIPYEPDVEREYFYEYSDC